MKTMSQLKVGDQVLIGDYRKNTVSVFDREFRVAYVTEVTDEYVEVSGERFDKYQYPKRKAVTSQLTRKKLFVDPSYLLDRYWRFLMTREKELSEDALISHLGKLMNLENECKNNI